MSGYVKTLLLNPMRSPIDARIVFYGAAILLGAALGSLVVFVPPLYLAFFMGGLVFIYLLLAKIEMAFVLALFMQNILGEFNYLGGGTPFHPNGIMGAAITVGAVIFFLFNKSEIPRFRKVSLFLLFFLVCFISTLRSQGDYFMESLTVTIRLATALSIFAVLLFRLDSIAKVKCLLGAIVAAQIYPTIWGLLTYAGTTGLFFNSETFRLGHSGVGVYLAMILILCLVFFLNTKTTSMRLLWGCLVVLFMLGLYFSFGRAGWISFIVAVIAIGIIRHKKLLFITPLLLILILMLVPSFSQRFSDISLENVSEGSSTLAGRIEVWRAALNIYSSQPVFGVGYGIGRYRVGEYLQQYGWMIHNDYISVLLETGLVGFVIFLLWKWQWLVSLLDIYKISIHEFDRTMALAVFAMLLTSLVACLTDNVLLDSFKMYPLCALIAATFALPRIRAEMENSRE